MSALGQFRTFAVQNGMSALPPKADIDPRRQPLSAPPTRWRHRRRRRSPHGTGSLIHLECELMRRKRKYNKRRGAAVYANVARDRADPVE